jgi:hypothetical protein
MAEGLSYLSVEFFIARYQFLKTLPYTLPMTWFAVRCKFGAQ